MFQELFVTVSSILNSPENEEYLIAIMSLICEPINIVSDFTLFR